MAKRLKPSEIPTAFSRAKAHAVKHATSQIIELVNAGDHSIHISSSVPLHQPLFEPTPAEVWIDEYTPFEPLSIKLRFRNRDTVVRRLKIEPPRSPIFRVRPWDVRNREDSTKNTRVDGKVAAGMEIAFFLDFFPQEVTDYSLDLVCCTERERFLLPVRVRGRFAALDLPDELEFGICPVKMSSTRVLTVRNTGTLGSSFAFQTSEHFQVTPSSATLTLGEAVQIELSCVPPHLESGVGELEVRDGSGQAAVVHLSGRVVNVDVFLSQPLVELSATYLSLSSYKTVKICNESEFTLDFSWKSFADSVQDEEDRSYLLNELSRLEAAEREQIQLHLEEIEYVDSGLTQSPFDVRKTLDTKYRHLRKATIDDSMHFVHACFSISPLSGRVWAHSEIDVVVCFTPEIARLCSCCAFLDIAGQATRLPLQIRGKGIGPKVKVVHNELLDFGDVFINDKLTRDFTIQNEGEIPADFELVPLTNPTGMVLIVHPSHGTLTVNAMLKIEVTFCSQELDKVSQLICFGFKGSDEQVRIRMKAHVIPPVLRFDVDQVNFGAVSYSFNQSQSVKLINTSKIAVTYSLNVPEEAKYRQKEFELYPSDGKLDAYEEQQITIRFTSHNVKVYQYQLVVGVTGVGVNLLAIPIRAQCFVPELTVLEHKLEFGRCFLRYSHKQMLVLENKSLLLPGRFEIVEQDAHSRAIATYSANQSSGEVNPRERVTLEISLSCEKLGSIRLPLMLNVPGSTHPPLSVTLSATGSGPQVELDQLEMNWGNCTCLVDHERSLRITNVSEIPAMYKTFLRGARSNFRINRDEGMLMAGESLDLVLVANLDDTVVVKDQLHILITEGENFVVPLLAKGTGTTMWSPHELQTIDFKHQLTSKECEWSCTLENKGKRVQVVTWINKTAALGKINLSNRGMSKTAKINKQTVARLGKSSSDRTEGTDRQDSGIPIFSVFPGTIELKPRTACVFVFKGLSSSAGLIVEEFTCETRVGKEKACKLAFVTAIRANFIDPKLVPSSSLLSFEYIHQPGNQITTKSQPLCLTNACELPLSFTLRTRMPFALDCWEAALQPGETLELNVEFHAEFWNDYTCRVINGKVQVVYTSHPQKDSIELLGDISFPNLSFEMTNIDFGCTLNDTQKSIIMNVTNISKVNTNYRWFFIEKEKDTSSTKKPYIPINQVFDIMPIRGLLKPNESEKVEFVYYGHANCKFKSAVACEVEGGPEYEVMLSGEASSLAYKLDKQSLDFGQVLYNKTEDRDFFISNVGKVPFSFSISDENSTRGRTLEVLPTSGKIGSDERQRVIVRLQPGIPELFEESIVLEIAHFQPIKFKLFGCGTFAAVTLDLPREIHPSSAMWNGAPNWRELMKRARLNVAQKTLDPVIKGDGSRQSLCNSATLANTFDVQSTTTNTHLGNEKTSLVGTVSAPLNTKILNQCCEVPNSPVRGVVAPLLNELDIEFEACRLLFSDYLTSQKISEASMKAVASIEPQDENSNEDEKTVEGTGLTIKPTHPFPSKSDGKAKKNRGTEVIPFTLSKYSLDFGNVVAGTHKIKQFSVTNIGHGSASFQLDRNLARSKGFHIEPERVVRLPERESIKFSVTFHARKNIKRGLLVAQLPIVIKNGPPCIAVLRAHVTVPDISISADHIDFGKIAVSTSRTMFTQLQNVSAVPTEWTFTKPIGLIKDVENFHFTPQKGILLPGAKANIQIEFVPNEGRHFHLKLPVKVTLNSKTRSIMCRGEGSELRISFHPPLVELGPILPCAPPEEQLVEIRNDSDYAVEVISLDFDPTYRQDEALLRSLNAFTSEKMLRLPVRAPGKSIAKYVAENFLEVAGVTETDSDSADPPGLTSEDKTYAKEPNSPVEVVADFSTAPRMGIDYILVGPPRCGKSTQACLLAKKEALVVWTIDGAIQSVAAGEGPLAAATRKALEDDPFENDTVLSETPEVGEGNTQTEIVPEGITEKLVPLLDQIILWRLAQPDLKKGSVLDSFENSYLSIEETIKCCLKALVTVRIIVLDFDENSYESARALFATQETKFKNTASTTISTSSLHVTQNSPLINTENGVKDKKYLQRGDRKNHDDDIINDVDEPISLPESSLRQTSMCNPVDQIGEPIEVESNNSIERTCLVQNDVGNSIPAASMFKPASFLDYSLALKAMKQQLASFILRDEVEFDCFSCGKDVQENELWTTVSDRNTPDNYILEIPINDVGPPLFLHNLIFSTIENYVRELRSSRLSIPSAATFQLVQYPPERVPRKQVTRFSLRSLSAVSPSMVEVIQTDGSDVASKPFSQLQPTEKHLQVGEADANAHSESRIGNINTHAISKVPSMRSHISMMQESSPVYRWVIAPHSSVKVLVLFASTDVGKFDCNLGFEIIGCRHEFGLLGHGICGVPTINTDPRNVFMHRVKSHPEGDFVQKKFVVSRNEFEFGPLIVNRHFAATPQTEQEFLERQKASPNNVEIFRMSNNSKTSIILEFTMEKEHDNTFAVFPPAFELKESDTSDVMVWACPSENGLHENSLICCIKDNPEPVKFHISCYGCTPELKLHGPWEQLAASSAAERKDQFQTNDGLASKVAISSRSSLPQVEQPFVPTISPQQPVVNFDQLLLNRQSEKPFYIENVTPVAIAWRLLSDTLPDDFQISPIEGTLKPLDKVSVLVVFAPKVESVYDTPLRIEFSDAFTALQVSDRNQTLTLTLRGEAYKVDVSSFDNDAGEVSGLTTAEDSKNAASNDGSLDFGLVRVGECHSRAFNIRNRGKYSVKYVLAIKNAASREYFAIEPNEVILEPGQCSSVNVTFTSKKEVTLRNCKDIKCTIVEMLSGDASRNFYVFVSVRSVFSKFQLQPNRRINFGPHKYSDSAQYKQIEIRNEGEFSFKFRVLALQSAKAVEKEESLLFDTPLTPSKLLLGQFVISPDCGVVDPGITMVLDVVFQPRDCAVYHEKAQIKISGQSVEDAAKSEMLLYELSGESCYPGILTTDYENIFEEQTVVQSLERREATQTPSLQAASLANTQTVTFAEKEKVFSFGPLIAASNWKGAMERFKILNPKKVVSTVHFSIVPLSSSKSGADNSSQVFTVQPALWEIPPLEHRFVSVYFRPTFIASFHATFRAIVDDCPPQSSVEDKLLEFELRGVGTLPYVTVTEPTVRDATGALVLDFGQVRTSKAKDMRLVIHNNGILPATVLFSIQANPNFVFALSNGSVVVTPKESETLTLQFRPQKVHNEPTSTQLKLTVQNNSFEETICKLVGRGYREDLVFEDLPNGSDDELHFEDICLPDGRIADETKEEGLILRDAITAFKNLKVFLLCNQSPHIVRFEWPNVDPFHFSPRVGHLMPREHKLISATFEPAIDRASIYQAHRIALQAQRITYKSSSIDLYDDKSWDESVQTISFNGQVGAGNAIEQTTLEPEFNAVGSSSTISLSCFGAADILAFEIDTTAITFRKTYLLQVCTRKLTLYNRSKIGLLYSCRWEQGLCGLSDRGLNTNGAGNVNPFGVTPSSGTISGEASQGLVIRFAPMDVDNFSYWLYFDILDTQGSKAIAAKVEVGGTSLRPACHFDLERSDYAQSRAPNLPGPHGELGPLDLSITVVEMKSLGVRVRNTRRFYVVNPTNVSYEFSWDPQGDVNPCFRCVTSKGLILAGKRCEMIFEFIPQQLELQEMFWCFSIPHFQISQLFLFVGKTTEPRVTLDRGSVNFNTLLIGTKTLQSISIVNMEHIPFNFVVDKTSLDAAGEPPALNVYPLSGVIPPNSRTSIDIEFIPIEEKSYNFNLNCIIKRKPTRLSLNVKGEGYRIHDALNFTSDDQIKSGALVLGLGNILDYGVVRVNEVAQRIIVIHNKGKFNFDFNWTMAKASAAFSIEPMHGTTKKNDKTTCRLIFAPAKQISIDGLQASCTVAGSRTYVVELHGTAVPPMLQFSFTSHDFGQCFIAESDSVSTAETTTLTLYNMDPESGIDLNCLFEKKSHLKVDCPPTVVGPRETIKIPIVFTARHEMSYLETIPFLINNSSTMNVSIRGEGVFPKVELVNLSMQRITFGNLRIGQQISRTVKIANRSKRKTVVECINSPHLGDASFDALGISIQPQAEISLRAKECADIKLLFAPAQRIPSFEKDLFLRVGGSIKKLLTLSGCCQGAEVILETDNLSYGAVCLGSHLVKKVRLQNCGDITAKFHWNANEFSPDFLVSPAEGIIPPNQHKTIEITFKPLAVNPDIRYDRVVCMIDGTAPAVLTLVGSCVPQATSSIEDVHFNSSVRQKMHKVVTIENTTAYAWNLSPVVQGSHWSCSENVSVPANGKANLDILYRPLTMTKQNAQDDLNIERPALHKGTIFLAIPDGSALLYNLFGKASSPLPGTAISLSTPAKKTLSIQIPIQNWLESAQTFAVEIQQLPRKESVILQGPPSFLIHAGATRNYTIKCFCYTEGNVDFNVRFVNKESGEYIVQDVSVCASCALDMETLFLKAPVRHSVKKGITIENPFDSQHAITYVDKAQWWKCSSPAIRVRQLTEISGHIEGHYEIEYRPTLYSERPTESRLTISFVELGEYTYHLVLTTQSVGPERTLYFNAPLGGTQTQAFKFTSYAISAAEFSCSVQDVTSFSVPSTCKVEGTSAWEGKPESVVINFEPEAIGEFRDTLTLYSDTVGEYKCTLQGVSVPPLPQGPYAFSTSKEIEFRNVFSTLKEFKVMVDNPHFVLSTTSLLIPAKSSKIITIKVDASVFAARKEKTVQGGASEIGKLFVSCPQLQVLPPWVYYLELTAK